MSHICLERQGTRQCADRMEEYSATSDVGGKQRVKSFTRREHSRTSQVLHTIFS